MCVTRLQRMQEVPKRERLQLLGRGHQLTWVSSSMSLSNTMSETSRRECASMSISPDSLRMKENVRRVVDQRLSLRLGTLLLRSTLHLFWNEARFCVYPSSYYFLVSTVSL